MVSYVTIDVYCNRPLSESDVDLLKGAVRKQIRDAAWFCHILHPVGKYHADLMRLIKPHPFNFTHVDESESKCIVFGNMPKSLVSQYTNTVVIK